MMLLALPLVGSGAIGGLAYALMRKKTVVAVPTTTTTVSTVPAVAFPPITPPNFSIPISEVSTTTISSVPALPPVPTTIPVSNGQRLIARQRVPGERIKEVDVITRKRVPYHEEVEVFEGPARFETYNGGEREYITDQGYVEQQTIAPGKNSNTIHSNGH